MHIHIWESLIDIYQPWCTWTVTVNGVTILYSYANCSPSLPLTSLASPRNQRNEWKKWGDEALEGQHVPVEMLLSLVDDIGSLISDISVASAKSIVSSLAKSHDVPVALFSNLKNQFEALNLLVLEQLGSALRLLPKVPHGWLEIVEIFWVTSF